jgi:hypothetical protein
MLAPPLQRLLQDGRLDQRSKNSLDLAVVECAQRAGLVDFTSQSTRGSAATGLWLERVGGIVHHLDWRRVGLQIVPVAHKKGA